MPTANATTSVTATLMPAVASVPRPLWPEDASRLEVPDAAGTEAAEEGSAFTEFDERLGDEVWLAGSFTNKYSAVDSMLPGPVNTVAPELTSPPFSARTATVVTGVFHELWHT